LYSALLLFLTLPVTVATLLMNGTSQSYASSRTTYGGSMGQGRLCALSLLSIEAESAELMKTEKLIDSFASAKARKKKFFS